MNKLKNLCDTDMLFCKHLERLLDDYESSISYSSRKRYLCLEEDPEGYRIENEGTCIYQIYFCPMCGQKFLSDLIDKWHKILKTKFGIKDFWDDEQTKKIPKIFNSDRWWKEQDLKMQVRPTLEPLEEFRIRMSCYGRKEVESMVKEEAEKIKKLGDICCTRIKNIMYDLGGCYEYPNDRCTRNPLIYEQKTRQFRISNMILGNLLHNVFEQMERPYRHLIYDVFFCPWCGAKLPQSLAKEWFEIVSKKFGITDLSDYKAISKLPKKYLTEKWWKEKGL